MAWVYGGVIVGFFLVSIGFAGFLERLRSGL